MSSQLAVGKSCPFCFSGLDDRLYTNRARGMNGMKANKVFNNNAVAVTWIDGTEAVLVGSGIGFGKRPGDGIDEKKIQKVYLILWQQDFQVFADRV